MINTAQGHCQSGGTPDGGRAAPLALQHEGREHWRRWGPYLAERAWGTVREDYSPDGSAWEYFDHDQARSHAYRWSEDARAPILKGRAFGLTGRQGNHGDQVPPPESCKDGRNRSWRHLNAAHVISMPDT